MRIQNLLLVFLLAGLYGCQPEAPVQEAAPVETTSSESAAAVTEAASAVDAAVSAVAEAAPVAPVVAEKAAVAKTVVPAKAEPVIAKAAPVVAKAAPVAEKVATAAVKTPAAAPMKEVAAVVAAPEVVAVVAKPAAAVMAEAPATAKGCKACHNIDSDKRKVGPGWVAVAHKYAGDAKGAETVAANIMAGGKFDWKMGNMPAKGGSSKLTDADAKELAAYIVGLK